MTAADAIVVGAGPAGCAAAITLARAGWRVAVVDRPPSAGDRAGESLSPAAPALLARLGLRERFLADGHLRCHANASAWGRDELAWHDFLRDPRGPAYHVDRASFEALLRAEVADAGGRFLGAAGVTAVARDGDRWRVGTAGAEVVGRYVVDSTGRAAALARRLNARRRIAWTQEALVAFALARTPSSEAFTLTEAVVDGFWYSAPIPGGRLAFAFFTDAALHDARAARTAEGFLSMLMRAPRTRERWRAHAAVLEGVPRFVGAGSGWLEPAAGPGWAAAGDAALTYDPVSAHGLTVALRTGIDVAEAIRLDAAGDAGALPDYAARLTAAFAAYRRQAVQIYGSERRWPSAPYWHRRHGWR